MSATLIVIFLATAVTTTYAWYAMSYVNDIDIFDFNADSVPGLYISTDGINFKSELSSLEIKKAILEKRGTSTADMTEEAINTSFKAIQLTSTSPINYKSLDEGFYQLSDKSMVNSSSYLSFDIYLTTDKESSGVEVFFRKNEIITSQNQLCNLADYGFNDYIHPVFGNISRSINLNLANAYRIGITNYQLTDIASFSTSAYADSKIYTQGSNEPTFTNGVYSFGGISTTPNLALDYFNREMETDYVLPDTDRIDYELNRNMIISSDEGLTKSKMIKLTMYIWIEGWDPDCFDFLKGNEFQFSFSFTTLKV